MYSYALRGNHLFWSNDEYLSRNREFARVVPIGGGESARGNQGGEDEKNCLPGMIHVPILRLGVRTNSVS